MLARAKNLFTFRRNKIPRDVIEAKDSQLIQKFADLASYLNETCQDCTPLLTKEVEALSSLIKDSPSRLDFTPHTVVHQSIYKHVDEKLQYLSESVKNLEYKDSADEKIEMDTKLWLRMKLLREYFSKLESSVATGDIDKTRLTVPKMESLMSNMLIGTGSDRLKEHMLLFGETVDQYQTQQLFYSFLEPEIQTCHVGFLLITSDSLAHKLHKKKFPKFSKYYLIDKLELNTKARCVFSWSDPNFSGFVAPEETATKTISEIISSREMYFEEAVSIGHKFMNDYAADTRLHYAEKQEVRDTLRHGVYFCIGTVLLDWLVCSI